MKGLIAGLGALGAGASRGYLEGQDLSMRRDNHQFQQRQRQRQEKLWAREDNAMADMDAADQAGAAVLKRYAAEFEENKPQNILGGMPMQQSTPFKPSREQLLEASQARTDALFQRGRIAEGMKLWMGDEQWRRGLRQQAAEQGLMAFKASGDPTPLLTNIYKHLDDGWNIKSIKPSNSLDQKASWTIVREDPLTGRSATHEITAEQIEGLVQFSMDPKASAEYSLKSKLEAFKLAGELAAIKARGDESRKTEGVKHRYGLLDNADRARHALGRVRAEGAESRTTATHKEGLERERPYTLGEGGQRMVDTLQPDGTRKPTKIAENRKDGAGARATTGKQLNDMVINNYGVLDPGTGRQVGNDKTQALSAAAERLMTDNEGLGANEAIATAARDMGLNLVPKKK